MKRREFLAASAAAAVGLMGETLARGADNSTENRQFYELRTYRFASPQKQQAFEEFLQSAAVPALNRAGVEPVGVFKLLAKDNPSLNLSADPTDLWVFLPHNSLESVVTLESRLAADPVFQKAGESVLRAPKSNPAFLRYSSTLLLAMEGAPRVVVPSKSSTRVFELRTYESHSAERAKNKLEMFNAGEFSVFNRVGMPGVFYGGAIIGESLPQLTYMVVHNDYAEAKKNWSAFGADPEWKKLQGNTSYRENVSRITDRYLRPAGGSQI